MGLYRTLRPLVFRAPPETAHRIAGARLEQPLPWHAIGGAVDDPALLHEVAGRVRSLLPADVTHLAAPEGAATLLLAAVALEAGLPMIVVRKEPKAYGTRTQVEGYPEHGAVVALIEDVSTTGHQVEAAARAVERQGCKVACIILALDRGGAEVLRGAGYRVEAVVSVSVPASDSAPE